MNLPTSTFCGVHDRQPLGLLETVIISKRRPVTASRIPSWFPCFQGPLEDHSSPLPVIAVKLWWYRVDTNKCSDSGSHAASRFTLSQCKHGFLRALAIRVSAGVSHMGASHGAGSLKTSDKGAFVENVKDLSGRLGLHMHMRDRTVDAARLAGVWCWQSEKKKSPRLRYGS